MELLTFRLDAWETGIQRDPMMDSDGEDADLTCKLDYGKGFVIWYQTCEMRLTVERRLFILNRIRGREPTPGH